MTLFQAMSLESQPLQRTTDPNCNSARASKRMEMRETGNYPLPRFIGVDGEGVTPHEGAEQQYVLLGVGSNQLASNAGLTFPQIMEFLYDNFRQDPEAVFCGFYLGYDFAMWLRGLPEGRARALLTSEGIAARKRSRSYGNPTPFPVIYGRWEFDILAMKRFKLRPACCDEAWKCKQHKKEPWMVICDVGPFWQTSLLKAIDPKNWAGDPIVSQEEYDTLVEGKAARGAAILDDSMRFYNALENDVLSRLMARQAAGLAQMGIRLRKEQWFGPGQASAKWMSLQNIPKREGRDKGASQRFQEIARRSFFGGWFEIFMHGKVKGTSFGYDINSAYPYVMSRLPCLLHGQYSHGQGGANTPSGDYILVSATVQGSDTWIGSMLHRTTTSRICRPARTRGVYWLSELEAAKRAGVVDTWVIRDWWKYEPCDCRPPMSNLASLYEYRQRVGKDTAVGKAAKLVYNSAYGKFAQSVGNAPFGNWVYASLTTSGCRSIILDAIATHPNGTDAVEMVATDGIFFLTPHPTLPISKSLGDWDYSEKRELFLFKPGFYWDGESKGKATYRSRGIRAADFSKQIPKIEAHFAFLTDKARAIAPDFLPMTGELPYAWPGARFDVSFTITSPLVALRQNDWSRAAHVSTDKHYWQSSDPRSKRYHLPIYDPREGVQVLRTLPYELATDGILASRPYDKTYVDADYPSEEELGYTPDGNWVMEWANVWGDLRGE